jgi:hypothetical protein
MNHKSGRRRLIHWFLRRDLSIGDAGSGAVGYGAGLAARRYVTYWESMILKKTTKSIRAKKTDGRQPSGNERLEMTDE